MRTGLRGMASKALAPIGTAAAVVCLIAIITWVAGAGSGGLVRGSTAPDFTLKDLSGKTVTLSQFRGKSNVLIHIGTTWCPPCRAQAPRLNELHRKYGNGALVVLAVDPGESLQVVANMAREEGAEYPTLLDPTGETATAYGASAIPLNVLVDTTGRIVGRPSHVIPENDIARLVGTPQR